MLLTSPSASFFCLILCGGGQLVLFAALLPLYIHESVWSSLADSPLAMALLVPSDGMTSLNLILMASITLGVVLIGDLLYDVWVQSKMHTRKSLIITYIRREWAVRALLSIRAWVTPMLMLLAMHASCCPDRAIVLSYISSMSGRITTYGTGMMIVADYVQSLFVTDTNDTTTTSSSNNHNNITTIFAAITGRQFSIAWRIGVCYFFTLLFTLGQFGRLLAEVVSGTSQKSLFQAVIGLELSSCVVLIFYLFVHSMKIMYSKSGWRSIVMVGTPPYTSSLTFKEIRFVVYTTGYVIYFLINFVKVLQHRKYYNSTVSDLIQLAAADLILTIGDT